MFLQEHFTHPSAGALLSSPHQILTRRSYLPAVSSDKRAGEPTRVVHDEHPLVASVSFGSCDPRLAPLISILVFCIYEKLLKYLQTASRGLQ